MERHTKTGNQEKVSCFFCAHFWHFQKSPVLCRAKGIKRILLFRLANSQAVRGGQTKENPICFDWQFSIFGGVGTEGKMKKFPQISVNFALRGVVGIRGRNIAAALAKSPLAALKVLREAHIEESATFLEQDSTTVPKFAYRLILSCGNLVGVATPSPPLCGLRRLKKSTHEKRFTAMKRYNTPHRHRVIKTRLSDGGKGFAKS